MRIVIVGDGKVGRTFAEELCRAGHDVTVVDVLSGALQKTGDDLDIMAIEGDGSTYDAQMQAGVDKADLLIAATSTDEMNLLICLIAKKVGARHTIARVRNPQYMRETNMIKDDLGLSMSINPELACATEMARVLRLPSAIKIDTFAKGRVEILKFQIDAGSPLENMQLMDLRKFKARVLVCAVERGSEVYIPNGVFRLEAGDKVSIVAPPKEAAAFFKRIGVQTSPVRMVMLIGGGRIAYYLAKQMLEFGADVKIIEKDWDVCQSLAASLPEAVVIHGDGTDHQLLSQEHIEDMDAVATLTGFDEQNVLMSLYARQSTKAKVITKINRNSYEDIIEKMDIGSVFFPRYIAAEAVSRYVRAMENSKGSNVETLYKIVGDRVEALEFRVSPESKVCGIPLASLPTAPGVLIGSINRADRVIIPQGQDMIQAGDTVVVVTTMTGLNDLDDILDKRRAKGGIGEEKAAFSGISGN